MPKQNPTKYFLAVLSIAVFTAMWFTAPHTKNSFQNLSNIALFVIITVCYLTITSVYFFLDRRGWLSISVSTITAFIPLVTNLQNLNLITTIIPLIFFAGLLLFDYILDKYTQLYLKLNFKFIFQQPLKLLFLVLSIGFSLAYYSSVYHQPPDIKVEIPGNVYQMATKAASKLIQQQMSVLELGTSDINNIKVTALDSADLNMEPVTQNIVSQQLNSLTPDEESIAQMLKDTVNTAIKNFVDRNRKYIAPALTVGVFLTLETSSFVFTIFAIKLISLTMWLLQVTKLIKKEIKPAEKERLVFNSQ